MLLENKEEEIRFWRRLIRVNSLETTLTILINLVFLVAPFYVMKDVTAEQSTDILTIGGIFIAITTATIPTFASYVSDTTDRLFREGDAMAKYYEDALSKRKDIRKKNALVKQKEKVRKNISAALLKIIFLQVLLWWTLLSTASSFLLALMRILGLSVSALGIASLSFLVMGILTTIFWMSLLVLRNTPGKRTYKALEKYFPGAKDGKTASSHSGFSPF